MLMSKLNKAFKSTFIMEFLCCCSICLSKGSELKGFSFFTGGGLERPAFTKLGMEAACFRFLYTFIMLRMVRSVTTL